MDFQTLAGIKNVRVESCGETNALTHGKIVANIIGRDEANFNHDVLNGKLADKVFFEVKSENSSPNGHKSVVAVFGVKHQHGYILPCGVSFYRLDDFNEPYDISNQLCNFGVPYEKFVSAVLEGWSEYLQDVALLDVASQRGADVAVVPPQNSISVIHNDHVIVLDQKFESLDSKPVLNSEKLVIALLDLGATRVFEAVAQSAEGELRAVDNLNISGPDVDVVAGVEDGDDYYVLYFDRNNEHADRGNLNFYTLAYCGPKSVRDVFVDIAAGDVDLKSNSHVKEFAAACDVSVESAADVCMKLALRPDKICPVELLIRKGYYPIEGRLSAFSREARKLIEQNDLQLPAAIYADPIIAPYVTKTYPKGVDIFAALKELEEVKDILDMSIKDRQDCVILLLECPSSFDEVVRFLSSAIHEEGFDHVSQNVDFHEFEALSFSHDSEGELRPLYVLGPKACEAIKFSPNYKDVFKDVDMSKYKYAIASLEFHHGNTFKYLDKDCNGLIFRKGKLEEFSVVSKRPII